MKVQKRPKKEKNLKSEPGLWKHLVALILEFLSC